MTENVVYMRTGPNTLVKSGEKEACKNEKKIIPRKLNMQTRNPFTARVLDGDFKVTLTFESVDEIL